jgi:integrase/recombinase XerD
MYMRIDTYIKEMKANGLSQQSIDYTTHILNKLDKFKPIDKIKKEDIVRFFEEFDGADSSRNLYVNVIKKFFTTNKKESLVDWLKEKKVGEKLTSDDILTISDINLLISHTESHFFKALISFLFESGCRISEARALKYGDFKDTTDGLIVHIPSKKTNGGFRKVILPFSSQYIKNLKLFTYAKDENKVFPFVYSYIRQGLVEIGKEAGITKPVNPHMFRHSQATLMVKEGYNESIIRRKHGWSSTSKVIARYQHLSDEDVINATLEINGKKRPDPKPREEILEVKPVRLEEAANRLFELEDENQRLNQELEALKNMYNQDTEATKAEFENLKKEMENRMIQLYKNLKEGKTPEDIAGVKIKK